MSGAGADRFVIGPAGEPAKYTLVRQVGSGGEATLWEATVPVAGQPETVAVKVLRPEHDQDFARFNARWAEQAELLRFVRHPSVVGVREHFESTEPHRRDEPDTTRRRALYLVMNWVGGLSLDEWVVVNDGRDGALAGLRLLEQVADALDELHSGRVTPSGRPVVHGDISPRNVMVGADARAILVDFGLARLAAHETRLAFGTPGYTAPEVWREGRYSPASDRYAFAALGYFALLGQAPPSEVEEIRASLFASPLLARVPLAQQDMIMHGFAADPQLRPTAREWLSAVRGGTTMSSRRLGVAPPVEVPATRLESHPAAGPPRGRRVPVWIPWAASFALLILLAGMLIEQDDGSSNGRAPQAGATASPPPEATTASSPERPPVAVRRASEEPITLTRSYAADLDSMSPNWNVNRSSTGSGEEFRYDETVQGDDDGYVSGAEIAAVSGSAEYDTCEAATGYATSRRVSVGDQLCVRTSDYRYAHVTFREAGQGEGVFDVVVWDPPYASD